jgi:hypothetical protein
VTADSDAKGRIYAKAKAEAEAANDAKVQADAKAKAAKKAHVDAVAYAAAKTESAAKAEAAAAKALAAKTAADAKSAAATQDLKDARTAQAELSARIAKNEGAYRINVSETSNYEKEMASFYSAAVWSKATNAKLWTDAALAQIRANFNRFERARDVDDFCPNYRDSSEHLKQVCWLRLIGALTKYESSFKQEEGFVEPDGAMSIGLMALSPDECSVSPTKRLLKDGILNLSCGIDKMAHLIERDGFINGPKSGRGAAAYWSVLRDAYEHGKYKLGKSEKIRELTRAYRDYPY